MLMISISSSSHFFFKPLIPGQITPFQWHLLSAFVFESPEFGCVVDLTPSQTTNCCIFGFNASLTLSQRTILDSSKLKEFAADNFNFDENGRKFSKQEENTVEKEKLLIMSNFYFSPSVFSKNFYCRHVKTRLVWERVNPLLYN